MTARLRTAQGAGSDGLEVRLEGELDIAGLPDIEPDLDRLLAGPPRPVLLDLAGLEFLDSTGVTVLVRIANHSAGVRTRTAGPAVRRVIEALGLGDRLGLEEG
jgi:anti-sigma B factor antagonist